MQYLRLPEHNFTRNCSPDQSSMTSPIFSRSERNTHKQNFQYEVQNQLASVSTSRNFIKQKSDILLRVDQKLIQQIKKKMALKKMNSKMSIISMQRSKFKVSSNKLSLKSSMILSGSQTPSSRFRLQQASQNHFSSILGRRQAGQYAGTSQLQSFRDHLKIITLNHPKRGKGRKSQLLKDQLLDYFIVSSQKQIKKDLAQLKAISPELVACLSKKKHSLDLNILRLVDRDISKLIFNICYEIYRKKQKGVTQRQLVKINKEIEYTSRRLKFFDITLRTCFDLGTLYCDQMEYEKAFEEYTHAIKLSIFLNDTYYREIAIDKLGVCKYYLGDSVSAIYFHNNIHHLSHYDFNRIKESYSNQKQIKRLIDEKKQIKFNSKKLITLASLKRANLPSFQDKENANNESFERKLDVGQFTFEKQNRKQFYPVTNNLDLKTNLKKIIKIPELRGKIHVLKRNLQKNDLIGTKRYCGQKYIVPTASMCSRKQNSVENNEVCLSHRSYNRNDIQNDSAKVQKDSAMLIMTLNYFTNQKLLNKQGIETVSQHSFDSQ